MIFAIRSIFSDFCIFVGSKQVITRIPEKKEGWEDVHPPTLLFFRGICAIAYPTRLSWKLFAGALVGSGRTLRV
jgi:hypothetical protein